MHLHISSQFDLSSLSGHNVVLNGSQDLPSGAQVFVIISIFKDWCVVCTGDMGANWLACWSLDQAIWVPALTRVTALCFWTLDTLLSHRLFLPRCINGYSQIYMQC